MTIDCPLHDGCQAWTGDERREASGNYQWECASGFLWFSDETGTIDDDDEAP